MKSRNVFTLTLTLAIVCLMSLASFALEANTTDEMVLTKDEQKCLAALTSDDIAQRCKAAQKLGEMGCKKAVEELVNMVKNDSQSTARIVAAHALLKIGDKSVLPVLKTQAKLDENKTVRNSLNGVIQELEKITS